GLRRGLANRLARDVDLLQGSGADTEHLRPRALSMGATATPLSVPASRAERRSTRPRARRRGTRNRVDTHATGYTVCTSGAGAPVRLSRNVRHRVLHERQAECAGNLVATRAGGGRRDPRSGNGRPRGARQKRQSHRGSLFSWRALALSKGTQRGRGG